MMPKSRKNGSLLLSLLAVSLLLSARDGLTILGRLMRNPFCSKEPPPLVPFYKKCSAGLLVQKVTVVVTVKDTCTQAARFLSHIAGMLPRNMRIIYVYPEFVGCDSVNLNTSLFSKYTFHKINYTASPIEGFLAVQRLINTPFALLTHNDAYLMDMHTTCELTRALQIHTEAAFAAPQLYERSENGIAVPHAHHKNLHLKPCGDGMHCINYDIDFDLLTQRRTRDFDRAGRPQMDFMEDHMYLARTDSYHLYLDHMASFTMEYIDNILAMRMNNTFPWYVPTARVIFDVDVNKIGWRDIPYFVHKRSEEAGLTVRAYLSKKWNVEFPNTGIWNYVRYTFLASAIYEDNALPTAWSDQFALFLSWFQSIGFNRYNNRSFDDVLHRPFGPLRHIEISRNTAIDTAFDDVRPQNILSLLSQKYSQKVINITLKSMHIPIGIKMNNECRPSRCGMLIWDGQDCHCFAYVSPYRIAEDYGMVTLLDLLKLPSRIFKFVQMRYTTATMQDASFKCPADEPDCRLVVPGFSKEARLIKWAWFSDAS